MLERLRPRIVLWCASRMSPGLRARVEPEDVAQEVLIALHKSLDHVEYDDAKRFFGWVFRVAENRIRDLVDYHGALKRQVGPPLSFTQTTPSRAASRLEASRRLQTALAELSDDHRLVIQLRKIEGRSVEEVCEAMGRGKSAVKMLYWRAFQTLTKVLHRMEESA